MPSVNLSDSENLISGIRNISADDFWVWTLILLGIGLACGYGIFYFIRRARILENTPTSKIRSAPQGYVEIIGKMQYLVNQPVEAPLTKEKCVWFSFKIEKKVRSYSGKSPRSSWTTVEEEFSKRPFQCIDETGTCMINPAGAEVYPSREDIWYGGEKWPVKGPKRHHSIFSSNSYRYTEKRLYADEPLYAIGNFHTVDPNKAQGNISDELRAVLALWKQDQEALLSKFDTNYDGQIDAQEWENVRNAAEQHIFEQRLKRADRPAINIMTKTDDFRRPYILSVKPQDNMVRSFRLKAFGCTLGFVLLGPVSIWMLFVRLSG